MDIYLDSYLDNNLGDDLMIIGLSRKFPNITFHIITDNSVVSQHYQNYDNIKIHKPNMRSRVYDKIDLYLRLGGSIFQITTIKSMIVRYLKYIRLKSLKRKGVKFAIMGCNVGPFYSSIAEKIAIKEMKLCEFITVRDQEAFDFVSEKASFSSVYLYDDIAFELLNVFDIQNKKELDLENKKAKRLQVGVTAYRSVRNKDINWKLYNVIVEFIDKLACEKQGEIDVYLYSFDTENENDLSAAHHLQKMLFKKGIGSEIIPYLGHNIEEFLNQFQSMDKIIAIRFHGAILSDYFQIPYFAIAYSNKLANYMVENTKSKDYLNLSDLTSFSKKLANKNISTLFINRTQKIRTGHIDIFTNFVDIET